MRCLALTLCALLAGAAFAGKTGKSARTYFCKTNGRLTYYNPSGRVPTQSEQLKCVQAGGRMGQTKGPAKAKAAKRRHKTPD